MKPVRLLAFAAFACLVPQVARSEPAATPAAATEVRLPHISIREIGRGDPVVLIPGLATPRAVWDGVVPDLARNHRVILVQVNGFGGDPAGANAEPGILAGAVADLAGWLAANRIGHPAVVGHSMGGLMGMMLARDHPDAVGKLLIVDALPFFGVIMGPNATVETVSATAASLRDSIRNGPPAAAAPPNMSNSEAGNRQVLEWLRASDRNVAAEALYEDLGTDLRGDVAAIGDRPITVAYAVPSAASAEMIHTLYRQAYAADPDARLVPVESSAHFIMLDQPQRFAAILAEFLGR
ncbi:MAG: alpha/beta hydrolase [Alphaproteobacteria bacterium]|nr:MAG: alpha/beta hydrolase [Alphaproteobacteria bacterium]